MLLIGCLCFVTIFGFAIENHAKTALPFFCTTGSLPWNGKAIIPQVKPCGYYCYTLLRSFYNHSLVCFKLIMDVSLKQKSYTIRRYNIATEEKLFGRHFYHKIKHNYFFVNWKVYTGSNKIGKFTVVIP